MVALPNLERISRVLSDIAMVMASVFIFGLALIGTGDVVVTSLFHRSIKGAIEISSVCYAAAVYLGLPYAQRFSQHIIVDVVTTRLSARWRKVCSLFGLVCSFGFLLYLSTRLGKYAMESVLMLERDSGVLMFPAYPFKVVALFGLCVATLEAGRQLLELILPKEKA